jgi:hypothetical protein
MQCVCVCVCVCVIPKTLPSHTDFLLLRIRMDVRWCEKGILSLFVWGANITLWGANFTVWGAIFTLLSSPQVA